MCRVEQVYIRQVQKALLQKFTILKTVFQHKNHLKGRLELVKYIVINKFLHQLKFDKIHRLCEILKGLTTLHSYSKHCTSKFKD